MCRVCGSFAGTTVIVRTSSKAHRVHCKTGLNSYGIYGYKGRRGFIYFLESWRSAEEAEWNRCRSRKPDVLRSESLKDVFETHQSPL